ncbi:MAG: PAS domain-containing protein [Desulfobacterales bacterium]|nr:PAS domain-containing protein [Desulfobacterales bacterium]
MTRKTESILNVAIVGGGSGCLAIMDMISMDHFRQLRMNIVGIADVNPDAPALKRAQSSGIYTTKDYHDLFHLPNLDLIIELTGSKEVSKAIQSAKPAHLQMIDHAVTGMFWDFFRLEDDKLKAEEEAEKRLEKEVKERSRKLKVSKEETRLQKRTAEGIIYGSPTPMFVVNKNHKVIYWNRACEKLTGIRSEEMIGTDRHWARFYSRKRPPLAHVIIDDDT